MPLKSNIAIVSKEFRMLLQIVLIFLSPNIRRINQLATIGQGIWCGVFFIITGGLGMAAANNPSDCSIITLMVFSIISAVLGVPHMFFDALGAVLVQSTPHSYVVT